MSCNKIKDKLPKVLVDNEVTDESYIENLAKMMYVSDSEDVNKVLSIIFSKLGLDGEDTVTIENVTHSAYDAVEIDCSVNDGDSFKVLFHRRYGKDYLGLALTDCEKDHYNYCFGISKTNNDIFDVKMFLKGYEIGRGTDLIICRRGYGGVSYITFSATSPGGKIEQHLSLDIKCSKEEENANKENGEYYVPKNEKALVTYLSNCSYPIKLGKVFQDIRQLSFDGDLSLVPCFNLDVITVRGEKRIDDRLKTDNIELQNGKLIKFGLSHVGNLKDCSVKNCGAAVEFLGSGSMRYSYFVPRKGYESLGVVNIDDNDNRISRGIVSEVVEELLRLFPEDAEKFLGEEITARVEDDTVEQRGLFVNTPRQFSKVSNKFTRKN